MGNMFESNFQRTLEATTVTTTATTIATTTATTIDSHRYETSCSLKGFLKVNNANTKKYGREAFINSAISSWNDIQNYFSSNKMLRDVPTFKLKSLLKKDFLETYNTS